MDNLVAIHKYADGSDYYVVHDALHSVRGISRRDGTWIASWRYRIYGAAIDSAGSAPLTVRYRWTGRELDAETGFYYFRARYYDPVAQRFVQEDPIGFAGGANIYSYGGGNPTNGRDPDGLRFRIIPPDPNKDMGGNCWSSDCSGSSSGGGASWFDAWWDAFFVQNISPGAEYEWAVWLAENGYEERRLSEAGQAALGDQCADRACANMWIVQPKNADTAARRGYALGQNTMFFSGLLQRDDGSITNLPLLGHEMVHMAQLNGRNAFSYVMFYLAAGWEHLEAFAAGVSPYDWQPGGRWSDYGIEQQGQIRQDCLRFGSLQAQACAIWSTR